MYSWMPKFGTLRSTWRAAASATGERSVAPCDPVRTSYRSASEKIRRRCVMPPACDDRGADVVDQLLGDQLLAVPDRVEDLADRDRRGRVLPDQPEASWCSAGVGSSIQNSRYGSSAAPEPAGLDRRQPVVDVVQQVEAEAERVADLLHHPRREVEIRLGRPLLLGRQRGVGRLVDASASAARRRRSRPARAPRPGRAPPGSPGRGSARRPRAATRRRCRWRARRPSRRRGTDRRAARRPAGPRPCP